MKILMLTYDLPYPLNSGGKIRDYYFLKLLSKEHKVTLLSFYRNDEQLKDTLELENITEKIVTIKRDKVWTLKNILRTGFSKLPFSASTYVSQEFKNALSKELEEKYDLIFFDSFYSAVYLPFVSKFGIKTYLGNVNVEWQIYYRYATNASIFLRPILLFDVLKMRIFEKRLWKIVDFNTAVSKIDAERIKRATGKACPVAFNGVNLESFKKNTLDSNNRKIYFIGNLKYAANEEAMKFFLKDIYPRVKEIVPEVSFKLVSMHRPSWIFGYLKDSSIEFIEDSKTPSSKFLSEASVSICPMRVASGTNIKVLESMAAGVPVVATSIGAEGLEVTDGENIIIVDSPSDFAKAIGKVFTEHDFAERLSKAGRELVSEKYTWEASYKIFEKEVLYRVSLTK